MATVLLTGATGYVGGRLLPLLESAGHRVRCFTRRPRDLRSRVGPGTEIAGGDLRNPGDVAAALAGVDTAYYLAHAMGAGAGFEEKERQAARIFAHAARTAGVKRIIYLGGLGQGDDLSPHLASRQQVGAILRGSGVPTIEFRASIIIGSGSLSFEMIRALVERLPVMIAPRWVGRIAQPIGIEDVLAYLLEALKLPGGLNEVIEIGGADRVSYGWLLREYARQRGLSRIIIPVPVLSARLSSLWLGLVTPVYASIGRKLVDSLRHDTVVTSGRAGELFDVRPRGAADAIRRALANEDQEVAATRWSDAVSSLRPARDPGAAAPGRRLVDSRAAWVRRDPPDAFRPIERIGGRAGWYFGNWIWWLRGMVDLLFGGAGLRRGRRHPHHLSPGDTVDWWRVEAVEPDRLLRLRAEMRLPGRAWLQFEVEPVRGGSVIRQTAIFDPRGLLGRLYWFGLAPVHHLVFAGMLRRIARAATVGAMLLLAGVTSLPAQASGEITGRVTSAVTGGAVPGAVVDVLESDRTATTDAAGAFRLDSVRVGIQRVRVRAIGYAPALAANVVVGTGKPAVVGVQLNPAPILLAPVEVTPGYYPPIALPAAERRQLDAEEIRRAPGVQEDVIRAVAVLPGVGVAAPGRNDLVVRGGAPYENLFVVDGVEVPNLNHFGSQGSSGGPLSLVNVDFVEAASFSAGGFGVRHGDRTAGLTDIRLRDGNDLGLSTEVNLSATGAGAMLEGPLGPRATFWAGVRRSYLDLLFRAAGFSFVPTYWDGQFRLAARPTDRDALSAFWVGALDGVNLYNDDADARYDNSRILVPEQRQYAGDVSWRRFVGAGTVTTTLGRSFVRFSTAQRDSLDPPRETFANRSREGETSLRIDGLFPAGPRVDLNVGAVARWAGTLEYDVSLDGTFRRDAAGSPRSLVLDTSFTAWRAAAYAEGTFTVSDRVSVTAGVRADRYDFASDPIWVSPRAQLRLALLPSVAVTLSGGRMVQPPQYIWLVGDPRNAARLTPTIADQGAFALELRPRDDLRLRVEGYHKWYRRYTARLYRPQAVLSPTGFEDVTSDIPFGLEPLASTGRGRAWGFELFAQKKPGAGPWYGLATVTLAWSRFAGTDGVLRPGAFDARLIGTVLAGYRAGAWELSGKFRGSTGTPTTPFVTSGPDAGRLDFTRYNDGPRLPAFHALDLRVNRRWSFRGVQLETYIDVQNLYGRANVTRFRWDARSGTTEADESLGVLPTIGVNVGF